MKKILLFVILMFTITLLTGQDRKVRKEIDKFYLEATNNYYNNEYDSAIVKLDILDFLYEDNSNVKYFLGMCYFFKSDYKTAITHFEKSLIDVTYINDYENGKYAPHVVYFYLGFSYELEGYKIKAIESYENYIKYERDPKIIYNMIDKIDSIKKFHEIPENYDNR